jgi:hypothetical protein
MISVITLVALVVLSECEGSVAGKLGHGFLRVYVMLAAPSGLAHFFAARVPDGLDWICRPLGAFGPRA